MSGFTTELPPCMVYVFAPAGFIVNDCPAQIAPEFTVNVGLGFTVRFIIAEPIQPAAVPVKE